jgi:hypothetical protein
MTDNMVYRKVFGENYNSKYLLIIKLGENYNILGPAPMFSV